MSPPIAGEPAADEPTQSPQDAQHSAICPFCRSPQSAEAYLCTHCARLFRLESLDAEHRFWGDAFYLLRLPSMSSQPALQADVGPDGLVQEQASFDLGDRYTLSVTSNGVRVVARVRAWQAKEVDYHATVEDSHHESGKIVRREVFGELRSKPKRFLYRRIDFSYDADRIVEWNEGSWIYTGAADWKKRPAEWIRHSVLDVRFDYEDGGISNLNAERRVGTRDLRGNAEYEADEAFTQAVRLDDGAVSGFAPPQPIQEEEE